MTDSATQPQKAEGERDDEPAATKGTGQGRSSEQPAEGGDDAPAGNAGSPGA